KGKSGMPDTEITMAELFQSNGYATGHIGKWHLGYTEQTMPNNQGFDYSFGHMGGCIDNYSHFFYWNGPNRHDLWRNGEEIFEDGKYFGDLMVEEMQKFITSKKDNPFFLYWAINWPHYPLQGTSKWREKYKDLPHPRDKYATFVSSTDDLIGKVIKHLESLNLREKTIILFQSDHGHSVEERTFFGGGSAGPYRGHKGNLFEGGLRVPSVVSWPGRIPAGEVRDQLVCGIDWFPTLADLAGITLPSGHKIHGKPISKVLQSSEAESPHSDIYWQLGSHPTKSKWVVRKGDWKLLGNTAENVRPDGVPELTAGDRKLFLVNLAEDIGETKNVSEEHPDIVRELLDIKATYDADIAKHLE
ncbi:MAG: sulfatase-like hydrolase/transferase, partial [Verrucomicrobiales bacterium]|nr:sulfatase-like hydrolase/transferase [Verrucomicrobiales bacterium]